MLESLEHRLRSIVDEAGSMPFRDFVEAALYDTEQGFYATSGRAGGHQGDFVTSAEVGPLFAAVVADWLDQAWIQAGKPTPFRVAEAGAGVGTLFRGIHRAAPACFDVLLYTLVERSAAMQVAHQTLPSNRWRSAGAIPPTNQHVVLANELLDNLAFDIAERTETGWAPVRVQVRSGELVLAVGSAIDRLAYLGELAPDAAPSSRVPVASGAVEWITSTRAVADRVLVFDYTATTAELAKRTQSGWLRTYAAHRRGNDPLVGIGELDITHDVPVDQLPPATTHHSQADWLRAHGLAQRVEAARKTWTERGHIGDLEAIAARSAISEAEALTDPSGLGAFGVLEWIA